MKMKCFIKYSKLIFGSVLASTFSSMASPGFGRGGGQEFFFFRFGNLHVAHGEAIRIARGVRGHAPPRNFFKTVQFDAF